MKRSFLIVVLLLSFVTAWSQQISREQSDLLFAEGVEKYRAGKYADALTCFEQVYAIDQQTCLETETRLYYGPMWMAACHFRLGNKTAAEELDPQHYMAEPVDRRLTVVSDSLSTVAQQFMAEGKFEEALPLMTRCAEMEHAALGNSYWYVGSCTALGQIYEYLQQHDQARTWYEKAVAINVEQFGKASIDYLSSLYDLAFCYHRSGLWQQASDAIHECQVVVKKTKNENDQRVMDMMVPYFDASLKFAEKQFDEAIKLGEQALEKARLVLDFDSMSVAGVQRDLAEFYAAELKLDQAIAMKKECLPVYIAAEGENSDNVIAIKMELAALYSDKGDYEQAQKINEEMLRLIKSYGNTGGSYYINCLQNLADIHIHLRNYDQAATLLKEALDIVERDLGKQNDNYLRLLVSYGKARLYMGDTKIYRQTVDENLNITRALKGEQSPEYADVLMGLADYYMGRDSIQRAIDIGQQALDIVKNSVGKSTSNYIGGLQKLSYYYIGNADYQQSLRLLQEAMTLVQKYFSSDDVTYFSLMNNMANVYSWMQNQQQSLYYNLQVLKYLGSTFGKDNLNYTQHLLRIVDNYSSLGDIPQAIDICKQALTITEKLYGSQSSQYSYPLAKLAELYAGANNYADGLTTCEKVVEIRRQQLGPTHMDYGTALQNLASAYNVFTNYNKAIELQQQAISVFEKVEDKDNNVYLNALVSLAGLYNSKGDYANGLHWAETALKKREQAYGTNSLAYAYNLSTMVFSLIRMERYADAIPPLEKAIELKRQFYGEKNDDYQMWMSFLAMCNMLNKNFTESEKTLKKLIAQNEQNSGELVSLAGLEHLFLSLSQLLTEKWKPAAENAEKAMNLFNNSIYNFFGMLNKQQRESYWAQYRPLYEDYLPKIAFNIDDQQYSTTLYDATLLSKGLLLNTEIEVNQLIRESGDTTMLKRYEELQAMRQTIDKLRQMPQEQRAVDVDSLQNRMMLEEQQLARISSDYGDYTARLRTNWQQVKEHLKADEMAVEFVHADGQYAALTLFPWLEQPHLVKLFTDDELATISPKEYYTTARLYNIIWKKMGILPSVTKTIYFSPAGELHNIAVEYVPTSDDNEPMTEHFAMYRLSSTREVVFQKKAEPQWHAVLYGGLEYDADPKSLNEENQRNNVTRSIDVVEAFRNHLQADSLGMRAGVAFLEGTLREVEAINKTIDKKASSCKLYIDMAGTEESLKSLSGKDVTLIHVATHGFYWPESESNKGTGMPFLQMLGDGAAPAEDKALTRSGLLFAGANNVFTGTPIPDSQDDGILTARELSLLDLRHTDLVVLSACQTALGQVTGDGVFGLQRGFKKAGAKTLLMSLWKVDDTATQLLMTEFYRQLTTGKTRRESFIEAQRHLRQTDNGRYDKPEYWAAFILLDATE